MKTQIRAKLALIEALAIVALSWSTASARNVNAVAAEGNELQFGTFWSLQRSNYPPFPINPFPDRPLIESKDGKLFFDDRDVDYKQLNAELAAVAAEQKSEDTTSAGVGPAGGGAGPMDANGNDLRLSIELIDGELKRISFNSRSGLVYYVEQTANLVDWVPFQTLVADDTNEAFHAFDPGVRFFRVREGDDRIQFPDWAG